MNQVSVDRETNPYLIMFKRYFNSLHKGDAETLASISTFVDRALSLGYTIIEGYPLICKAIKYTDKLGKYYNEVSKPNRTNLLNISKFLTWVKIQAGKDRFPYLTDDKASKVQALIKDIPGEYIDHMVYYYHYQHLNILDIPTVKDIIYKYLQQCQLIGKEPVGKCNNFLRELAEVNNTYLNSKKEYDKKAFCNNYAKKEKAWNFTYGDFTVVIPKEGQDLITEGARMNHCVGGYIDSVVQNYCYICFIRKTDNIDQPYITCQVMPNGKIAQYYLAYDKNITNQEDIEFKKAYQEYLNSIW